MSARTPIKCPICAKSNKVSGLRKLLAYRARRCGEISRAKIWRSFARDFAREISRAKMWRYFAREIARFRTRNFAREDLVIFRARNRAISHGSPETLTTGNSHACPKCEPTRARPNCLHNPPSMPQRSASRDALFVNDAQLASRICQQTALTGGPTLPIWAGWRDQKKRVHI